MWDIIIPIATFIVGAIIGGVVVSLTIRKQMTKMQSDPVQIQALARSMGMNLNQKQMNMVKKRIAAPSNKKKKKK